METRNRLSFKESIKKLINNKKILNDAFTSYSYISDFIGGSYEDRLLANCYFDIAKKINIYRIILNFGKDESTNIFNDVYKDMFTEMDIDDYNSVLQTFYDVIYEENDIEKYDEEKISLEENKVSYIDFDNVKKIVICSTSSNVDIHAADSAFIYLKTEKEKAVHAKYSIINDVLKIRVRKVRHHTDTSTLMLGLPNNIDIESVFIRNNVNDTNVESNLNNLVVKSYKGSIRYKGNSKDLNLETEEGNINVFGKSNLICLSSKEGSVFVDKLKDLYKVEINLESSNNKVIGTLK